MFKSTIRSALTLTVVMCVLTGVVYPGVVTGAAQLLFPRQANGSLVTVDGQVVGSELIGQTFTRVEYFHSRPSAIGYDAGSSGASNKGPTDRTLADTVLVERVKSAVANDGAVAGAIPADMVTASASGLDPHISPANAQLQVKRVASARGADSARVRELVDARTEGRQFGVFGEPRVNVLLLNIALDSAFPMPRSSTVQSSNF